MLYTFCNTIYSIWNKEQENEIHLTKLDLALQMLQALKKQLPLPVRLCVAMDSWYFVKSLYLEIEKLEFDWVTKKMGVGGGKKKKKKHSTLSKSDHSRERTFY
jgi:hypothetical protein